MKFVLQTTWCGPPNSSNWSNLLATKASTRRFSVQCYVCDQFHLATSKWLRNPHLSLTTGGCQGITNRSLVWLRCQWLNIGNKKWNNIPQTACQVLTSLCQIFCCFNLFITIIIYLLVILKWFMSIYSRRKNKSL